MTGPTTPSPDPSVADREAAFRVAARLVGLPCGAIYTREETALIADAAGWLLTGVFLP